MINDYPNLQNQQPGSQKLVLPGQSEDYYQSAAYKQRVFVHPDQLQPQVPIYTNPFSRLTALWRSDPAYKVLMVATVMVMVAGIIFATFLISAYAQSTSPAPKAVTPIAKANTASTKASANPPTFPTPSGGQGSKQSSSQPPASAPVVLPTLTPSNSNPQATQPAQDQNLQLQISDYPQQVSNNSDVQITVTATQPGISVRLQVSFDNSIITNTSDTQVTDDNGMATLNWHVANVSFKQNSVARITAYGTDQNGQQVSSQTISLQVSNRLGF